MWVDCGSMFCWVIKRRFFFCSLSIPAGSRMKSGERSVLCHGFTAHCLYQHLSGPTHLTSACLCCHIHYCLELSGCTFLQICPLLQMKLRTIIISRDCGSCSLFLSHLNSQDKCCAEGFKTCRQIILLLMVGWVGGTNKAHKRNVVQNVLKMSNYIVVYEGDT